MAGIKGRSGPPKNQNAVKHGAHHWLRSRRLPAGREFKEIDKELKQLRESLLHGLGGIENLSAQQVALLDDVVSARAVAMLLLRDIKRWGIAGGEDGLRPAVKALGTYLNTARLGLLALGLKDRSGDFDLDFDLSRFSLPPL